MCWWWWCFHFDFVENYRVPFIRQDNKNINSFTTTRLVHVPESSIAKKSRRKTNWIALLRDVIIIDNMAHLACNAISFEKAYKLVENFRFLGWSAFLFIMKLTFVFPMILYVLSCYPNEPYIFMCVCLCLYLYVFLKKNKSKMLIL